MKLKVINVSICSERINIELSTRLYIPEIWCKQKLMKPQYTKILNPLLPQSRTINFAKNMEINILAEHYACVYMCSCYWHYQYFLTLTSTTVSQPYSSNICTSTLGLVMLFTINKKKRWSSSSLCFVTYPSLLYSNWLHHSAPECFYFSSLGEQWLVSQHELFRKK